MVQIPSRPRDSSLFQTEREATQIPNTTKKTSLPISKTQSTAPNKHNNYGRMGNTLHVNTPKLRTVRPIYRTNIPLPSKCCILYIFSTNISTEYFKHAGHSPFFFSKCCLFHNATFLVPALFTFYIQVR